MKNLVTILFILILILNLISCEKITDENSDFYKSEERIGLWVNSDKGDTLEFVDNSNLIRKGNFYTYEEYLYRIDGDRLLIRLPDSSNETKHQILKVEGNSVILGNMYITTGFAENSGTFTKLE